MAFTFTFKTNELNGNIFQDLDSTGSGTLKHPLGYTLIDEEGREFKYCDFYSSDVTAVAGAPVVWMASTNNFVVTSDISEGSPAGCAGALLSILANDTASTHCYGWIQTKGKLVDVPSSGSQAEVAAKDTLYPADSLWKTGAIGTNDTAAIALDTHSADIGDIMLML